LPTWTELHTQVIYTSIALDRCIPLVTHITCYYPRQANDLDGI